MQRLIHSEVGVVSSTFPKWYKDLAQGMFDLHIHASPCIYQRVGDELAISRQAQELGYAGILFKCHHTLNADRAFLVRKMLPGMEIYGGLVLGHYVGGLNPDAVESALFSGAKQIWMPVFHSAHHINRFGYAGIPGLNPVVQVKRNVTQSEKKQKGISILNESGEVLPEVREIIDMVADADIILSTGHISLKEIFPLIESAKRAGVRKMLVTHAEHVSTGWSVEDQVKMANMGAMIEHCYATANFDLVAKALLAIGSDKCIMVTDGGSTAHPPPLEAMKIFVEAMLKRGLTEKDIEVMTKQNPSRLLGLT
jgi:hypothetical protein